MKMRTAILVYVIGSFIAAIGAGGMSSAGFPFGFVVFGLLMVVLAVLRIIA